MVGLKRSKLKGRHWGGKPTSFHILCPVILELAWISDFGLVFGIGFGIDFLLLSKWVLFSGTLCVTSH